MLKRENESLRSLAQGGGELAVPRELISRVEEELGLRFVSNPVVHRIAREELRDRVAAAVESRFGPSGADDRQDAFRLMGLLEEDEELVPQLSLAKTLGARGWFHELSGEGWVTDRYQESDIPDQAALLRLLARILLYQHTPLSQVYSGDDAARAREALHAGAAAGVESRFMADNARAFGFMPLDKDGETERMFSVLSPFVRGLAEFPDKEGKGMADSLYLKGAGELMKGFRDPPRTTRAVVDPAADRAEPAALDLPLFPEEPYLLERAGLLGLRLWLEPVEAAAVAMSWRNDRYALVPDGEASAALVWDIVVESPEAAEKLEAAALARLAIIAGGDAPPEEGKVVSSETRRHLAVRRVAPDRVRFVNAATPGFVAAMVGEGS